jgi:hypothetical protein
LTNTLKTPTKRALFHGRHALPQHQQQLMKQMKAKRQCLGVSWVVHSDNVRQKNNS